MSNHAISDDVYGAKAGEDVADLLGRVPLHLAASQGVGCVPSYSSTTRSRIEQAGNVSAEGREGIVKFETGDVAGIVLLEVGEFVDLLT